MARIEFRVECVLFNGEGSLLLALHEKKGKSYWVLPGGHVDHYERMEAALKRELKEELGANNVHVQDLLYLDEYIDPDASRHVVRAGFLVGLAEKDRAALKVLAVSEAIQDIRYYSKQEMKASGDTFYPSKEFFLHLMDVRNG
jgi:ADP-ribose pyrophosphatase YjhB (NUDIX family)